MYDVIISGAGPAGSKCAEYLAKKGFKVALIERDTTWRKPCGGGCSVRLFKYFPQLKKLDLINKHTIAMYSADYTKFEFNYKDYDEYSFVMDRLKFDNVIRDIAIDAGAELFDKNMSFDFVYKNGQKIGVKTKSSNGVNEFYGKIIIVADGMSSKLALKSNIRRIWKVEDLGLAKCAILEGDNNLDINKVYFYFRPYMGYGWIFPISAKRFNVGVITYNKDNYRFNAITLFKKFLKAPNIQQFLFKSNYSEIWSGAFPEPTCGVLEKSLYGNNLMIIGDAAGFVAPITGEGIHAGVVSGQIAAETAVDALERNDFSTKVLQEYKRHPNIKKIIRNFKLMKSFGNFFYEKNGLYLSNTFKIAEQDPGFKKIVADVFLFNKIPPKDFIVKIKNYKP